MEGDKEVEKNWFKRGGEERRHHVSREPTLGSEQHIALLGAHRLHIFQDFDIGGNGDWVVWLNTEASDFDGLVLGVGATREEAVSASIAVAKTIVDALDRTS